MEPNTKRSAGKNAFDELIKILNRADRSERHAKAALLKAGFSPEEADAAIGKAKEYGYLSDEAFSERYVFYQRSAKGKYRIRRELIQKGVDAETVESALSEYADSAEVCENLAFRYMKNKVWEPKTVEKLLRHLVMKGFGYEEARAAAEKARQAAKDGADFEIPYPEV